MMVHRPSKLRPTIPSSKNASTMSSETSTETVRPPAVAKVMAGSSKPGEGGRTDGLQSWQFFVLAGLGCATAATFLARGQGIIPVILLSVLMAAATLVGVMTLRAVQPLVSADEDRTVMIGARTRAALEREKQLTLRAIKDLEFDRAMGKLSDQDFKEMSARLRSRATRLIRQLDAGGGYRAQIEREIEKRLAEKPAPKDPAYICSGCRTKNDPDARFCKSCGRALVVGA